MAMIDSNKVLALPRILMQTEITSLVNVYFFHTKCLQCPKLQSETDHPNLMLKCI